MYNNNSIDTGTYVRTDLGKGKPDSLGYTKGSSNQTTKEESAIQGALHIQTHQLEVLLNLVYKLQAQLTPVLNSVPQEKSDEEPAPAPASDIRYQINKHTRSVESIQYEIKLIMDGLEV